MKDRPITTLYMLSSVDGKISTGASDSLDVDSDYPKLPGVRKGLHQYYEIEQTEELNKLGILKLEECQALEDSYIRLRYKVVG